MSTVDTDLANELLDRWQPTKSPSPELHEATPQSPHPVTHPSGKTNASPITLSSTNSHSSNSPITTKLIPSSMISMNNIDLTKSPKSRHSSSIPSAFDNSTPSSDDSASDDGNDLTQINQLNGSNHSNQLDHPLNPPHSEVPIEINDDSNSNTNHTNSRVVTKSISRNAIIEMNHKSNVMSQKRPKIPNPRSHKTSKMSRLQRLNERSISNKRAQQHYNAMAGNTPVTSDDEGQNQCDGMSGSDGSDGIDDNEDVVMRDKEVDSNHSNASNQSNRVQNGNQKQINHGKAVCDLTAMSTPNTPDSDSESDSDIEVMGMTAVTASPRRQRQKGRGSYNPSIVNHSVTGSNTNHSPRSLQDVVYHETANFERFTVSGIGGKLLRKAGWNGDRKSLYEKNGPIEQSTKYRSLNANSRIHPGLGFTDSMNNRNGTFDPSPCYKPRKRKRAKVRDNRNLQRMVRLPPMSRVPQSNTRNTAISLLDDDDGDNDSDGDGGNGDSHCVGNGVNGVNGVNGRNGMDSMHSVNSMPSVNSMNTNSNSTNSTRPHPGTLRLVQHYWNESNRRKARNGGIGSNGINPMHQRNGRKGRNGKRKRSEMTPLEVVNVDDGDDEDNEVMIVGAKIVAEERMRKIPFDEILAKMSVESENSTKKWIKDRFCRRRGGRTQVIMTKMVISVKDSYSQTRIEVPVRGRQCAHLQPFDGRNFLLRPTKYQKCSQCNQQMRSEELVKMEYFQRIFDEMKVNHAEIEQIEIMQDGTWTPVVKKERNKGGKSGKGGDAKKCNTTTVTEVVGIESVSDSDHDRDANGNGNGERESGIGDALENGGDAVSESVIVLSSSDEGEGEDEHSLITALNGRRQCFARKTLQIRKSPPRRSRSNSVVDLLDSSSDEDEEVTATEVL